MCGVSRKQTFTVLSQCTERCHGGSTLQSSNSEGHRCFVSVCGPPNLYSGNDAIGADVGREDKTHPLYSGLP